MLKIIETSSGPIRGMLEGKYYVYKGVPYGKAERFMPPEKIYLSEPFDAIDFGTKALQDGCPPGGKPFQLAGVPYGDPLTEDEVIRSLPLNTYALA